MGQYRSHCRICARLRPNEHFTAAGRLTRVCLQCRKLDPDTQSIDDLYEIEDLLDKPRLSPENVARLTELAASPDSDVAAQAAVMLEVARVAPLERGRLRRIRASHRELWHRMLAVGLVHPSNREEERWAVSSFPPEAVPCDDEEDDDEPY